MENEIVKRRGRKPVNITAEELQAVVSSLEFPTAPVDESIPKKKKSGETDSTVQPPVFSNRSKLFDAITKTEWADRKRQEGIVVSVPNINNWVRKFNITMTTPKGQRGRKKGERIPGAGRKKAEFSQVEYDRLRKIMVRTFGDVSSPHETLLQKAAKGSRRAVQTIQCISCVGGDTGYRRAIAECTACESCPLWNLRPFQKANATQLDDTSHESDLVEFNTTPLETVA